MVRLWRRFQLKENPHGSGAQGSRLATVWSGLKGGLKPIHQLLNLQQRVVVSAIAFPWCFFQQSLRVDWPGTGFQFSLDYCLSFCRLYLTVRELFDLQLQSFCNFLDFSDNCWLGPWISGIGIPTFCTGFWWAVAVVNMSGTQATQILAAEAASQAAIALKEANEQSRQSKSGFSEASKVVQCPKEFGCVTSSDDQALWSDFAFSFRHWLFFADPAYEPYFKHIEDNPGLTVTFADTAVVNASKERSRKLFLILGGILKHRPLKILRQVQHQNGFKAWRQLSALYVLRTKGRSLACYSALLWTMTEDATYSQVREQVLAHERISSTWSKDRVMADINGTALGTVTSYATGDSGVAPMEINQVKGKSKGKDRKAKEHRKGKEKTKANRKMVAKARENPSRVAKVMDLPPKEVGKHSQRPLMLTDATTVVPWDTGNEIAANFRLTKPMVLFDKLKLMDHLNMQHQAQAVLEQHNIHPVLQHIVLLGMSTVLLSAIALWSLRTSQNSQTQELLVLALFECCSSQMSRTLTCLALMMTMFGRVHQLCMMSPIVCTMSGWCLLQVFLLPRSFWTQVQIPAHCRWLTLMLVNHVNMRQLDKTSLMHKVENLTYVTQDLQLLTLAMEWFCVNVSLLQTSVVLCLHLVI